MMQPVIFLSRPEQSALTEYERIRFKPGNPVDQRLRCSRITELYQCALLSRSSPLVSGHIYLHLVQDDH